VAIEKSIRSQIKAYPETDGSPLCAPTIRSRSERPQHLTATQKCSTHK